MPISLLDRSTLVKPYSPSVLHRPYSAPEGQTLIHASHPKTPAASASPAVKCCMVITLMCIPLPGLQISSSYSSNRYVHCKAIQHARDWKDATTSLSSKACTK